MPTPDEDVVQFEHQDEGPGKYRIRALRGETLVHMDVLNPAKASCRRKFADAVVERLPDLERQAIEEQLLQIAGAAGPPVAAGPEAGPNGLSPEEEAEARLRETPEDVRREAKEMLADPYLLRRVIEDIGSLGVAGEKDLTATLHVVGVSRLLEKPLASIVQGPSSSGKSYVIEKVAACFPEEAVIRATQMTPQALFHMPPGSLCHRFVVAGERSRLEDDKRAEATRALREMLSSGKLAKLIPTKGAGNRIVTETIEQQGPIAYVESTTLPRIFEEDANRCLMLHTDERPEQTRRVLSRVAAGGRGAAGGATRDRVVARQHALHRMLRPFPVAVPFAERIAALMPDDRVEARRALPHLLSTVQAVALLHQFQRETDGNGSLVATASDYQLAEHLLRGPMARLLGGALADPARRRFDTIRGKVTGEFTARDLLPLAPGGKSSVQDWLSELRDHGLVELVAAGRGRSPSVWKFTGKEPAGSARGIPGVKPFSRNLHARMDTTSNPFRDSKLCVQRRLWAKADATASSVASVCSRIVTRTCSVEILTGGC